MSIGHGACLLQQRLAVGTPRRAASRSPGGDLPVVLPLTVWDALLLLRLRAAAWLHATRDASPDRLPV